jgi:hypothetical protein
MSLLVTLTTNQTYAVQVDQADEHERAQEILTGGGEWVEIGTATWVRRDSIAIVEITTPASAASFN